MGRVVLAAIAFLTAVYAVAEFRGPDGYTGLMKKREEELRLERDNKLLREEIDKLDTRVDKLTHDPAAQELEIRKRLGLVKEGETVYMLQDKSSKSK